MVWKQNFLINITCKNILSCPSPFRSSGWRWHVAVPLTTSSRSGELGQFYSGHTAFQHASSNASIISPGTALLVRLASYCNRLHYTSKLERCTSAFHLKLQGASWMLDTLHWFSTSAAIMWSNGLPYDFCQSLTSLWLKLGPMLLILLQFEVHL